MSSPLAEAFFLWTILTVVMKHPLNINTWDIELVPFFAIYTRCA